MADLTQCPARLTAGTTLVYSKVFDDFPNVAYTMVLVFAGVQVAGSPNVTDTGFTFVLSKTASAAVPTGTYRYKEMAANLPATESFVAGEGTITVEANPLTQTADQAKSYAERTLAVIELALTGRLTKGLQGYVIDGVQVQYYDVADLEKLRVKYSRELEREKNPCSGLGKAHKFGFRGK